MDMEEYFHETQQKLEAILKELENIEVKYIHKDIQNAKERAILAVKELYNLHEF
jgi:hypothetical protein